MLEGFAVCLQRRRGLGEERFKLQEELLALAASFPGRIMVSYCSRRTEDAQTLGTARPAVSAPA